jgi:hypothetical protein
MSEVLLKFRPVSPGHSRTNLFVRHGHLRNYCGRSLLGYDVLPSAHDLGHQHG